MNKPQSPICRLAASLICLALLNSVSTASAQLTVTTANQTGTQNVWPFTPTWVVDQADSLINGLVPTSAPGNWSLEIAGRNVDYLTVNTNLTIDIIQPSTTTSTNYVTYGNGSGAGSSLIYTLPTNANGYNITNISVYGGWANSGRDQQAYVILYSTVANPTSFINLAYVNDNPSIPGNTADAIQAVINNASGGPIANNVAAIEFVFNFPGVENGYCGIAAITVGGTAAPSVVSPAISITTSNESGANPFTPDWTLETNSLIAGLAPTTAAGNFALESSGGTPILTDGALGASGDTTGFATCGGEINPNDAGNTLIYTLTNVVNGSDVTNIVTYSGWGDGGRDGQYYTVSYSTIAAPTTYVPITTVYYLPSFGGASPANRVSIAMNDGSPLGSGVANIKFDFSGPPSAVSFNNGYQGYSEIIVQGHDSTAPPPPPSPLLTQDTLPNQAETVIGDQVVLTAAYSNSPPVTLQWQQVTTGPLATNNINTGVVNVTNNGVVTSTLTLNNVLLTSSGSYRLQGLNATNGSAAPSYSTASRLAVGSSPAPVNNVIVNHAGQTAPTTAFYPAWNIDTNADLIYQFGNSGAGVGNFGIESGLATDPAILTDGSLSDDKSQMVSGGWVNSGAGTSMTYTMPASANGYDITNIAVYGGWPDDGRNEQAYQVLYSTVSAPSTFVPLVAVDYNPSFSSGEPSATRTTLVPATGAMVHNVVAVEINFGPLQPKNGWEGYSEITIGGTPSLGVLPAVTQDITPLTAEDVVGSSLILTAGFTNATSYQWTVNGTNISGATNPTLVLSNLQLTNTGSYALLGINAAGTNKTRACTVKVDPAPAPVGNVVTSVAYQTSDAGAGDPFGPTWDTSSLTNSLIYLQAPPIVGSDQAANFIGGGDVCTGQPALTDGSYGVFAYDATHPAFAACGPTAGNYVIYQLGNNSPAANGYNVTNIQIAGGWNDNGRNSQFYSISYSTVANTNIYHPMVSVRNSPSFGNPSVIRTTFTPAAGLLASNVYAVYVDFTTPAGVPNGYSGYSEISVFGSPSATLPPPTPTALNNPSFELNATSPGTSVTTAPTYWTAYNGAACGSENAGGTDYTVNNPLALPAAGNQFCYVNITDTSLTGGIYQDVGPLQSNTVYTLTVAIGSRADRINSPGIISLINGTDDTGTVLATTNGLPATQNTWQDYAVTFTTGASVSGNLVVDLSALGAGTIQANFDNVRLTTGPLAPAFGMLAVSGGNLILTGTGGTAGNGYTLLTTTNLTSGWITNTTGAFDGSGNFSNAIPINVSQPASFFRLRTP